jgi:hypothetical protein
VHDQNGNHVHDHGTAVRPGGGGTQQNAKYLRLDDGLYALQADGTYSKVEGKRPQSDTHTQSGNHVHDHGTAVRPSGGGTQQNGKYLRLDDGLYVLQSDGTYMRAQDVPRPVSPGNRPNSNNQQVWQNDGRRPQPQPQWVDNRPVRPNRPSNNQDVSGLSYEGNAEHAEWDDGRSDVEQLEQLGQFLDAILQ